MNAQYTTEDSYGGIKTKTVSEQYDRGTDLPGKKLARIHPVKNDRVGDFVRTKWYRTHGCIGTHDRVHIVMFPVCGCKK